MSEPEAPARPIPAERGIFCNRTLNLRSIKAIGYDMDYTLIHYHIEEWERRAYAHLQRRLLERGWPVSGLELDPTFITRGLIIDVERGNLVKANRFGYVKRACHGTRLLDFEEQRAVYGRELVDLGDKRYVFVNTSFAISEGCMYAQLVELLDQRRIPEVLGYRELYQLVRSTLDQAHMEGELKAEIMADPDRFVDLDPDVPLALLDQKRAGKRILLITNSDWTYTRAMMSYAFDRFLPAMSWRELFDISIVSAAKPGFFAQQSPMYELVDDDGQCRPLAGRLREGGVYLGGHAGIVEPHLGLSGEEILFVGDHIFADVNVSKSVLRWRTALVARELEEEIRALSTFREEQQRLAALMEEKEALEHQLSSVKLSLQRLALGYGPPPGGPGVEALRRRAEELRGLLVELDQRVAPLAKRASELQNPRWGLSMRTGNDKSHFAKQVERHADIYTSRVSNFLYHTPFVYLRSPRTSLPHDAG